MSKLNHISTPRIRKGQVVYDDWECEVLLAVNGKGVTVEKLAHVIPRSTISIAKKASQMGVSLRATKRNSRKESSKAIFKLIGSLGLATVDVIIEDSGIPESSVRTCLRDLVKNNLLNYKRNESGGYIYYI